MLRDLARAGGATPPEVVAVGATAGFFVTAFPLLLYGAPGAPPVTTRGRTLHLSLPEMAILDIAEFRTVLAHELAHFSGEDTAFSVRFQPLYAGLGQGAEAMSLRQIDWGGTWVDRLLERAVHPHTTLAVQAYEQFSHVVAHWDRVRELEADRAAIVSGSAVALASSLLRTGIAAALVRDELAHITKRPDQAALDITEAPVARIGTDGANDAASHLGDQAPHPTDTHPPTWERIEAAGVAVDEALLARAARPVDPADFAAMRALFTDWDALARLITAPLRDRALQQQEDQHAALRAAAAATAGAGETALYASLLRPALGLKVFGLFCLLIGVGCVLAARYGGVQDRESWRLLAGVAAACAIGLGFVARWSWRLWRGRAIPYLVLSEDGIRSRGLDGAVPWLDVIRIGVSARRSPTTWFVLRPDAALPQRTGLIRLLQIDGERRAIQIMGLLQRSLTETALRTLLLCYADAAYARDCLQADGPAGYNCPRHAVPTEENIR
jgi:Zn-dependent protease with chaperone function